MEGFRSKMECDAAEHVEERVHEGARLKPLDGSGPSLAALVRAFTDAAAASRQPTRSSRYPVVPNSTQSAP